MAAMPSARSIGVGAFVLGGVLLFAVALFLIGNRRMLFADSFTAYAEFRSISGIQVGSGVRVEGMDAGEVKDIVVPPDPAAPFRLRLQVREDLHPLVRRDSVATIQTQGLVGAQFVQIGAGSKTSPRVSDGGLIRSREPLEFSDLLQQMSDTITQVNATIAVLRDNIEQTIGTIQHTALDTSKLIRDVSDDVGTMSKSGARIFADAQQLLIAVRAGRGTVGRLFTDDQMYRDLASAVTDAQKAVASVRQAAEQARDALSSAGNPGGQIATLTSGVSETMGKAKESMANLEDATEALKHNFLLRGYFTRRGYFTLADLSPLEYRRGALEANGRRALRVWLRAEVLLGRDASGAEVLTAEGKARLDSAIGPFLQYRHAGPIVVEGYSPEGDEAARFLASRVRALLARTYLVNRFQLDPTSTGAIALGREATGSPAGEHWDGVALALFVDPEVLGKK
jgi:phospholipid/cholesterol/gamma-HCH transport system substrate-binding protein